MDLQVYTHWRYVSAIGRRPSHHLLAGRGEARTLCGVAVKEGEATASLEEVLDPDSMAAPLVCQVCLSRRTRKVYKRRGE